jgi:superfamily I DNA/RNA helicase
MVGPGPDDMFLAGDTHQRIYDNYVSLGSLGISIRGRSSRLTLSYRSTHEILQAAEALLGTEKWDDLDDGADTLSGYRSVLHGPRPAIRGFTSQGAELAEIARQVKEWLPPDGTPFSIGIAVPDRQHVKVVEDYLGSHGIPAGVIGADGPRRSDAVHVGTMHRFKGLEYQYMILGFVSAALIPARRVEALKATDTERYEREVKRARSLLFVAATRARDALVITWNGQPSPFLPLAVPAEGRRP